MSFPLMRLQPEPPLGSIYFSQAHSLRWLSSERVGAQLLYREILSYALFFEALVISDSHAVGNWEILEMLPGGRFDRQCSGIDQLFKWGALRVARRVGPSLQEIAFGQMRRSTPVMVEGKLTKMTDSFLHAAERLQAICSKFEIVYDLTNLNLGSLLETEVLDVDSVCRAYGINSVRLRRAIAGAVRELTSDGPLFASDLFNFRTSAGPLSESRNIALLQRLATSTHSCNFAISLGLLPSVSPNSDDHKGATALYERFTPEIGGLIVDADEKDIIDPTLSPMKIIPTKGEQDFTERGVAPILKLRASSAFKNVQKYRERLFAEYRSYDSRPSSSLAPARLKDTHAKFAEAMVEYLTLVGNEYGITSGSSMPQSNYLATRLAATARNLERVKELDALGIKYILPAIAAIVTPLVMLGIAPQALLFATCGAYATTGAALLMRIKQLNKEREKIEKCSRVLNLVDKSINPSTKANPSSNVR